MVSLRNVLVASDFGEPAHAALAYGRELARVFHARLHVVHVLEDISERIVAFNGPGMYMDLGQWRRDIVAGGQEAVDKVVTEEDRRELGATGTAVLARSEAEGILDYASDHAIDLIVLGTHGRRALSHLVLGSVAERVVRLAKCPVLVVRHPEREFVLPDSLQTTTLPVSPSEGA